mgnify:CR=1 FL=1
MQHSAAAVGDNCIDNYLYPIASSFVGGNALNVAVALRRYGIKASYVGAVGDDEQGQWVLDALKAEGVDASLVQVIPGPTGVTDVELRCGDRLFLREDIGVMKHFRLTEDALDFIATHELVHSSYLGQTVPYLARFKSLGLTVSFDYSDLNDERLLHDTLPFVDIAFASAPSANLPAARKLAAEIRHRGPRIVVITMGAAGSLVLDDDRFWEQRAVDVDRVVDTLGAGDAFIGTFLGGLLEKRPMEMILQEAALRAAQVCTHFGAWAPQPERQLAKLTGTPKGVTSLGKQS